MSEQTEIPSSAKASSATERLNLAVQARGQELELFWKRSLVFWGFIAAAFVGYAAALGKSAGVGLLMACFGLVCSLAWTLANRGSKYWQENWEQKVQQAEVEVVGPLFAVQEPRMEKGPFSAFRFSVSRLAIALSDFTVLVWAALLTREGVRAYGFSSRDFDPRGLFLVAVGGTLIYALAMALESRGGRGTSGGGARPIGEHPPGTNPPTAVMTATADESLRLAEPHLAPPASLPPARQPRN